MKKEKRKISDFQLGVLFVLIVMILCSANYTVENAALGKWVLSAIYLAVGTIMIFIVYKILKHYKLPDFNKGDPKYR